MAVSVDELWKKLAEATGRISASASTSAAASGAATVVPKKGKTEGATCGDDEVMRQLVLDRLAYKANTQLMMDSKGFVMLFKTAAT